MRLFVSDGGELMVAKGKGFDFAISTGIGGNRSEYPRRPATQPLDEATNARSVFDGSKVASWGANNNFPKEVIKDVEPSTVIGPVLSFLAKMLVGKGIRYYLEEDPDENTGDVRKRYVRLPEVEQFMKRSNINRLYATEAAQDMVWWANIFPELGLSIDGSKIVRLVSQDASFCRYEVMNERKQIKNCFISAYWPSPKIIEVETVPVIDQYDVERVEKLRKSTPGNYIYPVSISSPGAIYYQRAPWDSARSSQWLKYSLQIPKLKQAIIENSMNIKYHIEIPEEYWIKTINKFQTKTPTEKQAAITPIIQAFIESFTGADNGGKAFSTPFYVDPATKAEYGHWKINVLKNDFSDKLFIEDSIEASSHLLMALGTDRALVSSPGKGMGSGSGSDKRVAFNIADEMMWTFREALLEPLYFISEYNGWPENLKWEFISIRVMTLDTGKESITVTNPDANADN